MIQKGIEFCPNASTWLVFCLLSNYGSGTARPLGPLPSLNKMGAFLSKQAGGCPKVGSIGPAVSTVRPNLAW